MRFGLTKKLPIVIILISFVIFFPTQKASAQQANASQAQLSLEDAISLSLENNLNLKKINIDIASSGYSEKNIWAEIFPSITASAGISYSSALFSQKPNDPANYTLEYPISFGISLGLNAGIPYTIKNIKLAHQLNILQYEDACNQLAIQITKKYYSLAAEKSNLLLLDEIFNLAQKQYERNQVSFRNGLIRELILIQSNLAVENARYSKFAAEISYKNNMAEFLALLGMAYNDNIILSGEIKIVKIEVDPQSLISEYLPQRPDIERVRQEIQRLENAERQLSLQNRSPSLSLSMSWRSAKFDPFTDRFSGSATLNVPIDPWIPGTSKSQSTYKALNSIEKAKLDLTMAENTAKTQINSLAALLRNSWDSIEIVRLGLKAAQRNYELTEEGFRNGTVEFLTLENARNDMADFKERVLKNELNYFNMILDLSSAINMDWKTFIQRYGVSIK